MHPSIVLEKARYVDYSAFTTLTTGSASVSRFCIEDIGHMAWDSNAAGFDSHLCRNRGHRERKREHNIRLGP